MTTLAWPEPKEDWIQLYQDFGPRVQAWVKRRFGQQLRPATSPEDIWQDTFLRATKDQSLPERPPAQICRYLLVIARNRCLAVINRPDVTRGPSRRARADQDAGHTPEIEDNGRNPAEEALLEEKKRLFIQILLMLEPAQSRPAFIGRFVQRRRYTALGREWGITANAAKKRAMKAMQEFRAIKFRMGLSSTFFISRK